MVEAAPSEFAAIFDMDGVLIDSVSLNWRAINQALEPHAVQITSDRIKNYLGQSLEDQVEKFNYDFGLDLDFATFRDITSSIKAKLVDELKPIDGAKELVDDLHNNSVPLAVGTSNEIDTTIVRLSRTGLLNYFQILVTKNDVQRHKPDPETYQVAAERLGYSTSECVVFEDAPAGVKAAKAAGALCVAVATIYVERDDLFQADEIIDTLADISTAELRQMFA